LEGGRFPAMDINHLDFGKETSKADVEQYYKLFSGAVKLAGASTSESVIKKFKEYDIFEAHKFNVDEHYARETEISMDK